MTERIQKILAQVGVASRRRAEQLILAGRVTVNGHVVKLGDRADAFGDRLCLDGQPISTQERPLNLYLLIHKPIGVVSTCDDPQHRRTVLDLLPVDLKKNQGIYPVGRLDVQSTGALLLTNDGELTLRLTHPRYHIPKTYRVWLRGHPSAELLDQWRNGLMLDNRKTLPAKVTVKKQTDQETCVEIVLTEGRNRQIRRVADQLGFPVVSLQRTAIGKISLAPLEKGKYRHLNAAELSHLKQSVQLADSSHHYASTQEQRV